MIKIDLLRLMQQSNSLNDFFCPCGSSSSTEHNMLTHLRSKHPEAHKAYINIKNNYFPFGDLDKNLAQARSNFDKDLGSLAQQLVRMRQLIDLRQPLPKQTIIAPPKHMMKPLVSNFEMPIENSEGPNKMDDVISPMKDSTQLVLDPASTNPGSY
jgi:hypothetical protein